MLNNTTNNKIGTKLQNLRMNEQMIEEIKKKAQGEKLTFSEYVRKRIYCEPIILEKLNCIINLLNTKNGVRN